MKTLLVIVLTLVLLAALHRLIFGGFSFRRLVGGGSGPSDFKCATCRHCRKLFDDGVRCGFGRSEVFKNETAINNCPDHESVGS